MAGLLSLLRAAPGSPEEVAASVLGADPAALVADAARHGLAGLLRHELARAGVELPEPYAEALRHQALAAAGVGLRVKHLLLTALDALAAEGVVPVLLKGYGLALRLYPEPLLRASTDVDLWVEPGALAAAERALAGIGLRPREPGGPSASEQVHHHELVGPAGMVELHHRLLSSFGRPLEDEAMLARSQAARLEGRAVRFLCPEDELAYLALHAMHHLLQRLAWLYDLELLALRHPGLDWGRVVEVASRPGFRSLAYFALSAAVEHLGMPVPAGVLEALAPASRWRRRVARRLFDERRLLSAYFADRRVAWVLAKLVLAEEPGRLARLAWHRLGAGRLPFDGYKERHD